MSAAPPIRCERGCRESVLMLLPWLLPALAQADVPGFGDTGDVPVVISATRLQQSLLDTPATVTVIDRGLIRASGARELPDILRLVPGMVVGRESGAEAFVGYHGTSAGGGRRMQVQVDGRSIYETGLARVDWVGLALDVEDIERIEVVRGPNSAAYGANSFFAVVNIITRDPQDVPAAELKLNHGENGIRDGFARIAGQALGADWRWSFSHREDDGYERNAKTGGPFPDDKRVDTVYGKGAWSTPRDGQLTLSTGISRMEAESVRRNDTSIYREMPVATLDAGHVALDWQQPWAKNNQLLVQLHVNTLDREEPWKVRMPYLVLSPEMGSLWRQDQALADRFLDNPVATCLSTAVLGSPALAATCGRAIDPAYQTPRNYRTNQDYRESRYELEVSNTWVPNPWLRLVGGVQATYSDVNSRTFLNGSEHNTVLSAFGHGELRLGDQWLLNLGGNVEDDAHAGRFLSPRAALSWRFMPEQVLRLVHSRAVRTPDIFEAQTDWHYYAKADGPVPDAFREGVYFQSARAEGRPRTERIRSSELGYYGNFRRASIDVRLFHDDMELTSNQLEIDGFVLSDHQPMRMIGAELGSEWRLTPFQRLLLNYAHLDIDGSGHGDNRDFVPRHSGSFTWARLDADGWRASATYGFYNDLNKDTFYDRADLHLGRVIPVGQRQRLDVGVSAQIRLTDDPELRRINGMASRQKVWASVGWRY